MSLSGWLLILFSACIHVVAHVALKTTRNRTAFVWWMLLGGSLLFLPVLILQWQPVSPLAWGVLLISAAFEAGYFAAIARAYHTGDLSIVYPLARGTAPLFLLVWSTVFLREHPTLGGVGGILLIAGGLYVVNLPRLGAWLEPLRALNTPGPRWALLAGVCISLYTVIDKFGITLLPPLFYTYLALLLTVILLAPGTFRENGWAALQAELRHSWPVALLAGFTTMAAYALVLYVMRGGAPAAYAGAVREISVVLGAAIGILFLKENGSAMRILGALLVAGGVVIIKLLG